jgi:hypothetical protein
MADAVSIVVTGERGGSVRRNLLFLAAGVCIVGATYDLAFMVAGLLALILLALGDRA